LFIKSSNCWQGQLHLHPPKQNCLASPIPPIIATHVSHYYTSGSSNTLCAPELHQSLHSIRSTDAEAVSILSWSDNCHKTVCHHTAISLEYCQSERQYNVNRHYTFSYQLSNLFVQNHCEQNLPRSLKQMVNVYCINTAEVKCHRLN